METGNPSVMVSSILGILLSPYAAFQQRKITQTEALKQTVEYMQTEVDYLTTENDRLSNQVHSVEESVSKLEALEETVAAVNQLQGESVQKLEEQLEESKKILSHMKTNQKAVILQNLVTVLLATDADADMLLSDEEIEELIQNLEGIHGVQLNEDLLRQTVIDQGRSVAAVMEVARAVLTPSDGESNIFSYLE